MPITRVTIDLATGNRLQLNAAVDALTTSLAQQWGTAWAELLPEFELAVADLIATADDGRWPSRVQVLRATAVRDALQASLDALQSLADASGGQIIGTLPDLTINATTEQGRIIASQLPAVAGEQSTLAAQFGAPRARVLAEIVRRTTEQVTALHYPLAQDATAAMLAELVRGIGTGSGVRDVSRRMLDRVQGRFNGGLYRAQNIARTEMLDAHRAAGAAVDEENSDVVTQWVWLANLDTLTCPSCLAMHGSKHPTSEAGPLDHQSGRCQRMPKALSWAELGYDVPGGEPEDLVPDARAYWAALGPEDQVAAMGGSARRAELLRTGAIGWDDLPTRRSTDGWRDSYAPRSVTDLEAIAASRA